MHNSTEHVPVKQLLMIECTCRLVASSDLFSASYSGMILHNKLRPSEPRHEEFKLYNECREELIRLHPCKVDSANAMLFANAHYSCSWLPSTANLLLTPQKLPSYD